jgi:hypothetical protein
VREVLTALEAQVNERAIEREREVERASDVIESPL